MVNSPQFLPEEKECPKFCVLISFKTQPEYILRAMSLLGSNVNSVPNRSICMLGSGSVQEDEKMARSEAGEVSGASTA